MSPRTGVLEDMEALAIPGVTNMASSVNCVLAVMQQNVHQLIFQKLKDLCV